MRRQRPAPRIVAAAIIAAVPVALGGIIWAAFGREDGTALQRGMVALEAGHPRTARIELMNAIKADPASVPARLAQARVYLALGDGESARTEITRARALGASAAETRAVMAHALLLDGAPREALAEARAEDIAPADMAYAARIAGQAWQRIGDMAAARAAFGTALARAPRDGALWADLTRFRLATGDQAGAIAASAEAVAFAPESADALTMRGVMVRDQFGPAAALPWFDRAIGIDGGDAPALAEYAATLADMGQARRALALSRRVLALEPDNARAWLVQALIAARAGRDDLARTLISRIQGDAANWPSVLLLRGGLMLRGGNPALAADALGGLLQAQPDNASARLLLARAQFGAGDSAGAERTLAGPYPLGGYGGQLLARSREQRGDFAGAEVAATRLSGVLLQSLPATDAALASIDPASAPVAITAMRAALGNGDVAGALARGDALRRANPGAPGASLAYGDVLMAAGRPADAAQAYVTAANLRFDEPTALRMIAAWRRAGRPDEAARVLSLFLSQNPMSPAANRVVAAAWADAGDWRRASDILESLRGRLGDNDALLMTDLAWAWLGRGDLARALAYARQAYRLQPDSPFTNDVYGWAMVKAGHKGPAAVDLLEKAASLDPSSPLIRTHLDTAYAAMEHTGAVKVARNVRQGMTARF